MKRPFRFTVGLGEHSAHLVILAADERTRTWALKVQARISLVTRSITDEIGKAKLETRERAPWEPPAPEGVMTVMQVRVRFAALLREAFPRLDFEVTAPPNTVGWCEPPPPSDVSSDVRHGMLGMMARGRGVEGS